MYPAELTVDATIPADAHRYLNQAIRTRHAPDGAIMLCASAVDAMLKSKDLRKGSLYARIVKAAQRHLITDEMANWAHEVRLDANERRHADDEKEPSPEDAEKCIAFTLALAEFLFVLPARVKRRGLPEADQQPAEKPTGA